MQLEALNHGDNCFVTLTYSNDYLPVTDSDVPRGTLEPAHPRNWLKRLRKRLGEKKLRYYLVGEYGDQTQRPHYHVLLFGLGQHHSHVISDSWGFGNVVVGTVTPSSCAYVAGYVTKKMTRKDDPRLDGRYPEFARMSLRPGIGAYSLDPLLEPLFTDHGSQFLIDNRDVPVVVKIGGRDMPLGRYLRKKMREQVGMGNVDWGKTLHGEQWLANLELQRLELAEKYEGKGLTYHAQLIHHNSSRIEVLERRFKCYKKRVIL